MSIMAKQATPMRDKEDQGHPESPRLLSFITNLSAMADPIITFRFLECNWHSYTSCDQFASSGVKSAAKPE